MEIIRKRKKEKKKSLSLAVKVQVAGALWPTFSPVIIIIIISFFLISVASH